MQSSAEWANPILTRYTRLKAFSCPVPPSLRVSRGGLGNKDPENPKESCCVFKKKKLAIVFNTSAG